MPSESTFVALARRFVPAVAAPLACALLIHLPGHAAEPGLTLAAAQQRALARSAQLRGRDAAVQAALDMAAAAHQLPDPMLKAGIDNLPVSGADRYSLGADNMTMRRIALEQELPGAAKRALRAERYERQADKARAEQGVAGAAIARDTALAWLDLYYAEQMVTVLDEQVRQAEAQVTAADSAYRGGRGSQADVLGARSAALLLRDRADALHRQRDGARVMLARWVGDGADLPPAGAPDLSRITHDPDTLPLQLEHHPEVAALNRAEDLARTEARLADAESRPDWRVEFAYQQRGPGYPNMVSIGVAVPLQWDRRNRQDREVAARVALAEQAHAEREESLRMHAAETRNLIGDWRAGLARLARFRTELLPLAHTRSEAQLAAYRGARASLADVLAARAGELDVRLQALALEADTARLWARLNFLFPGRGQQGAQ